MKRLFADSGYWIALLNPGDALHAKAVHLAQQFLTAEIVTSEMVLVEVLNCFSSLSPHLRTAAASTLQRLVEGGNALYRRVRQALEPHRLCQFPDNGS